MPKVSVIIPVYNAEKYLNKCLESLINQTLSDIEIICINDGSTDNSLKILQEYAQKDSRIRIIDKKNEGQGKARNLGIELANGEYLAFVDSDDWCELNMYEELYITAKNNDADLVECSFKIYNDSLNAIYNGIGLDGAKFDKSFHWTELKDKTLLFENIPAPWNKLCRTKIVKSENIRFGTTQFAEDVFFSLRIRILASKTVFINKELYVYRRTSDSIMSNLSKCKFENQINLLKDIKDFLIKQSCYESFEKGYINHAVGVLYTIYRNVSSEQRLALKAEVKDLGDEKLYKKFNKKIKKKFLKNLLTIGNKNINSSRYKVLTIFGFDIPMKKIF